MNPGTVGGIGNDNTPTTIPTTPVVVDDVARIRLVQNLAQTFQIAEIQALGCDVIVTDHHGTSDNIAAAFAVLNPRLPGAGYPDRDLAGVGVAFCLANAVAQSFSSGKRVSSAASSDALPVSLRISPAARGQISNGVASEAACTS